MTPEHLAIIDNFKCDNCGKCEACLLIEEFVANEKILKKKGTLDERLVVEFADKFVKIPCTSHAGTEWVPDPDISKWLHVTFSQIRADERARAEKAAWCAECAGCPEGHPTFWKTVIESPQWKAWEEEQAKRFGDKNCILPVFDIDECRETNVISQKHFQEFMKFVSHLAPTGEK